VELCFFVDWQVILNKPPGCMDFGFTYAIPRDGANALVIVEILENGPAWTWNRDCKSKFKVLSPDGGDKGDKEIRIGDRIVGINDQEGTMQALEASALTSGKVELQLQRFPANFKLMVTKGYESQLCGIRTELRSSSPAHGGSRKRRLFVLEVQKGGLFDRWNRAARERGDFHLVVIQGLEITKVWGITGDPEAMRQAMREELQLLIAFKR